MIITKAKIPKESVASKRRSRLLWLMFGLWLAVAGGLASNHVFWRDEVRALSFAISGNSLAGMFATLRGDSHPLTWFLLLRAGHAVMGGIALPAMAFAIGLVNATIILWRSPFSLPMRGLLIFSHFMLWDGTVMARNYGISALLMLAFVLLYRSQRDRGLWLIMPLMLLANTNVHSMLLSWLFLGVWMGERHRLLDRSVKIGRGAITQMAVAALLLAAASAACIATIYPTFNDAAVYVGHRDVLSVIKALLLPGFGFLVKAKIGLLVQIPLSIAIYATLLRFAHDRLLLVAAWVGTAGLSLFFTTIYPASERHIGLWLMFLVCLRWIDAERASAKDSATSGRAGVLRRIGNGGFYLLLAAEVIMMAVVIVQQADAPESQSRAVGALIAADPSLARAIIIGDPDTVIEPLPYYAPKNPVYRIRQEAFGPLNHYTRQARLDITLDDILETARRLRRDHGQPVVILLSGEPRLDRAETWGYGYDNMWKTRVDPAMARRFLSKTVRMARFPPAMTDESYSVYRLND